jgi:outer membrane lipoprotein-sorting protein
MKKILLILALLPLSLAAQQDATATKILDEVSNKNKAYTTTTVDFEFNITDTTTKQNDKKTGTLKLKGTKYSYTLMGATKKCNGKFIWTINKTDKSVDKDLVSTSTSGGIKPNEIFTIYKKGYKSKYIGEKKLNNKVYQVIELVPDATNKSQFRKITIYVDKAAKQIYKMDFAEKRSAKVITIVLKKLTPNVAMPDADFEYTPAKDCPGCTLNDVTAE